MQLVRAALAALGLVIVLPASANAASYILGDSHGVALAQIARVKGLAAISVHIRGTKALKQIARTPPNSTAYLVLGTNDAVGSIAKLERSIDDIVRAADRRQIKLVWIGPPCVRKAWDTRARDLDRILSTRLANTSVRYISMRDREMCSGALHAGDGVHLKPKGYSHMWARAATIDADAPPSAVAAEAPHDVVASVPREAFASFYAAAAPALRPSEPESAPTSPPPIRRPAR
jgi:hypothetical protein